ncbi:MAG: hypothetical protein J6Z36_02480 [Clostridia bacterium]|nr:hypothetical protein [Clostridia bacterium]
MTLQIVVLFILIASFIISNKKMRVAAIFQAVLSIVLAVSIFCFFPNSIFAEQTEALMGKFAYYLVSESFQASVPMGAANGISIFNILCLAVAFLTLLIFIAIVEHVREKIQQSRREWRSLSQEIEEKVVVIAPVFGRRIYLQFCRLLN